MYRQEKKYYMQAFFVALAAAAALLAPLVIFDGGKLFFYGDYNLQQVPFYINCINAVHEGNLGWDWSTDIGVNFIGSYGFYTLGSPFFWIAALFPAKASVYLLAPLMALKFALSSLFAFVYIRRFTAKPEAAVIGGLLYAFSGFSIQSVVFNHFLEAVCFFPLLLTALEESVVNKRRGVFALAVALNALVNYFFFFGECVFLVIYFIMRLCMSRDFRIGLKDFFCLAFESVAGVAIAGVLFIPSIVQVFGMNRAADILVGMNTLVYDENPQRYGAIFEALLCPPEQTARSIMFPHAGTRWASISMYLPLFSLAGVCAFMKSKKKHWIKGLLLICLLMAFVPVFNSMFSMFNSNYYARWYYMPCLIASLATAMAIDSEDIDVMGGWKINFAATLFFVILVEFTPFVTTYETFDQYGNIVGSDVYRPRFLFSGISVEVALFLCLTLLMLPLSGKLLSLRAKTDRKTFFRRTTAATVAGILAVGWYSLGYGRSLGFPPGALDKYINAEFDLHDDEVYRISTSDHYNRNMLWNLNSPESFISTVPAETESFYEILHGVERSVTSEPNTADYPFSALMGIKYFIINTEDQSREAIDKWVDDITSFSYYDTQDGFEIYVNDCALPIGFAYDRYVLTEDYEVARNQITGVNWDDTGDNESAQAEPETPETTEESEPQWVSNIALGAAILDETTAEKYRDILSPLPEDKLSDLSYETFLENVENRKSMTVDEFSVDKSVCTAKTSFDTDRLVMFSIPADRGWSAEINGKPVEIDKVHGGLIGLRVPAGEQTIVLSYKTPGLTLGIIFTVAGAAALAAYIVIIYAVLKRRPKKYAHTYPVDISGKVSLHAGYITTVVDTAHRQSEPRVNGKDGEG